MSPSDREWKANNDCSQAKDLENALGCECLQDMLRGRTGAFSSRYWFINEYINYVNLLGSDPTISSSVTIYNKSLSLRDVYNLVNKISQFAKIIFSKKNFDHSDILFVSRSRMVRVKTESGWQVGDYVFYSVVDGLKKGYPDLTLAMYLIDDSYQKYKYATPKDLLRSTQWAIGKTLMWTLHAREAIEYFERHGCEYAAEFSKNYFRFRLLFRNALLGYSMKNLFDRHKPKVIVSNDDCMYTKPLNNKDNNINSPIFLVLQSARMVEYGEECRSQVFQESGLLPDYFLASGTIFRDIKERWNIAEKVVVTGLPRYDILNHVHEVYSKQEFLERYGLNPVYKIVHWSTQCHVFSQEENTSNLRAIFGAIRNLENVCLIIKQHPAESEEITGQLKNQIKNYGIHAIVTPKNSDTYEQLFICDLMITRHSTTAMEAVALDKPVIILNLSGKPDPVEYVEEGVALGVYKEEDLCATINKLLKDDSELSAKREHYIQKYLYKIDGKATQRVIDIVLKSLERKN